MPERESKNRFFIKDDGDSANKPADSSQSSNVKVNVNLESELTTEVEETIETLNQVDADSFSVSSNITIDESTTNSGESSSSSDSSSKEYRSDTSSTSSNQENADNTTSKENSQSNNSKQNEQQSDVNKENDKDDENSSNSSNSTDENLNQNKQSDDTLNDENNESNQVNDSDQNSTDNQSVNSKNDEVNKDESKPDDSKQNNDYQQDNQEGNNQQNSQNSNGNNENIKDNNGKSSNNSDELNNNYNKNQRDYRNNNSSENHENNQNLRKNSEFNNRSKQAASNEAKEAQKAASDAKKANDAKKAADTAKTAAKTAQTAKTGEKAASLAKYWKVILVAVVVLIAIILVTLVVVTIMEKVEQSEQAETGSEGLNGYAYLANDFSSEITILEKDGSFQNYDLEDYIAAVLANEVGLYTSYDNGIEALKAHAIATRTYTLKRLSSSKKGYLENSPNDQTNVSPKSVNPSASYTFEDAVSDSSLFKQAADATKGLVLYSEDSESLISAEYDAFAAFSDCGGGEDATYYYLCQGYQKIPKAWMQEHIFSGYSSYDFYKRYHHGRGLSQLGALYFASEENKDFESIINFYYGPDTNYKASLYSIYESHSSTIASLDNPEQYITVAPSSNKLTRPIKDVYTNLDSYNNEILANVQTAGPGTGEAVAAAAITMIYKLDSEQGLRFPYSWAGGQGSSTSPYLHNDVINDYYGLNPYFGNSINYQPSNGTVYTGLGLDCAGFVTWSIHNGGVDITQRSTHGYANIGTYHNISEGNVAKPGDILLQPSHHIMLVLGYDESKGYLVAEASGASEGLLIRYKSIATLRTAESKNNESYYLVSMSDYYASHKTADYVNQFNQKRSHV